MSAVGNLLDDLTEQRDRYQLLYMKTLLDRDESRREHLVTQEQLARCKEQR